MSLDIGLRAMVESDVVDQNITHNLTPMWREAGVYEALYKSEGKTAKEVIPILEKGLKVMMDNPERFKKLDSPNGWGLYKNAVPWLTRLIINFKEYPDGVIWISR